MADSKAEPSTPYGEGAGDKPTKAKNPATGEPSTPYGGDGAEKSPPGVGPVDKKNDPEQQPT